MILIVITPLSRKGRKSQEARRVLLRKMVCQREMCLLSMMTVIVSTLKKVSRALQERLIGLRQIKGLKGN